MTDLPSRDADAIRPTVDPAMPGAQASFWLPSTITLPMALLDLGLILLVLVVLPDLSTELWAPDLSGDEPVALTGLAIAKWLQAGLAALVTLWLLRRRGLTRRAFGLTFNGARATLLWGCGALIGLYTALLGSALLLLMVFVAVAPEQQDAMAADSQQRADLFGSLDLGDPLLTAILLVAVALHEELIFRALILPYLQRITYFWWVSIPLGAMLFGAMHGAQGVLGIFQASLLGLVLGTIFVLSRSIWPVILAHFAFDWLQFALIRSVLPLLEQMQQQMSPPGAG